MMKRRGNKLELVRDRLETFYLKKALNEPDMNRVAKLVAPHKESIEKLTPDGTKIRVRRKSI